MLDAHELLDRYRRGATDPSEVVEACLARIDAVDDRVHSVVTRCDERARARAAESARRWAEGTPRALEGIPIGVKDIIETAGLRTAAGSAIWADHVPVHDAVAVARVEAAGAVVIGKTATPELAFGDERQPGVTNPWSPERWTGGSSSGSAAALAARLVPLALGTDTGGSIRVPSSYCGVTGLKPTFGRVPRTGVFPVSWTLDHVGPMACTAADAALLLSVLAGPDASDPSCSTRPVDDYVAAVDTGVAGLRLGVPGGWLTETCDPAVLQARDEALHHFAVRGATIVPVELPHAELGGTVAWIITVVEFASHHESRLDRIGEYSASAAQRLAAGARVSALDYTKALRARELVQRDLDAAFAVADALVLPATPSVAPELATFFDDGDRLWLEKVARTFLPFNVTGAPALVLPTGFDGAVPTAMQIVARPFAEATCLRVGAAWQAGTEHHLRVPPGLAATPEETA
jgi:aspartyl-tRNA(Asn)/glutamyl-tRNA(Gln) amidotransferase subunit A